MCRYFSTFVILLQLWSSEANSFSLVEQFKECAQVKSLLFCLKEKAVLALEELSQSNETWNIYDAVEIAKDEKYDFGKFDDELFGDNVSDRSLALNDLLYKRIKEFFESRIVRFRLGDMYEGRRRGGAGGGKKGGMMLTAGLLMALTVGQLFLGKIAFLAGTALLLAKMALALSLLTNFKKSGSDSGRDKAHVVYATNGGGYGGNWHRNIAFDDDPHSQPYKSYFPGEKSEYER